MANTFKLSGAQRFHLELLLGSQRGNIREIRQLDRIISAIELTPDERDNAAILERDGVITWNRSALDAIGPQDFSLDDAHVAKILEVLSKAEISRVDLKWAGPLMDTLTAMDGK